MGGNKKADAKEEDDKEGKEVQVLKIFLFFSYNT